MILLQKYTTNTDLLSSLSCLISTHIHTRFICKFKRISPKMAVHQEDTHKLLYQDGLTFPSKYPISWPHKTSIICWPYFISMLEIAGWYQQLISSTIKDKKLMLTEIVTISKRTAHLLTRPGRERWSWLT